MWRPDIHTISFGSRALAYSASTAGRGMRSSSLALTMTNGRGEIFGTQWTGSRRGPLMMTFAIPAANARTGAIGMLRFMFASSGTYDPPDPWIAHTRVN